MQIPTIAASWVQPVCPVLSHPLFYLFCSSHMERALLVLIDSVGCGPNFLIKSVLSTIFHCLSSLVSSRHSSLLIGKNCQFFFNLLASLAVSYGLLKVAEKI